MTPEERLFTALREGDVPAVKDVLADHPEVVESRDSDGATPLHLAALEGRRDIVHMLLDAGADVNARDERFGATPAGWAIEYLRERGGLLAIEIDDARRAIEKGDASLLRHYLRRFPDLRDAQDEKGIPLRQLARDSGNADLSSLFEESGGGP